MFCSFPGSYLLSVQKKMDLLASLPIPRRRNHRQMRICPPCFGCCCTGFRTALLVSRHASAGATCCSGSSCRLCVERLPVLRFSHWGSRGAFECVLLRSPDTLHRRCGAVGSASSFEGQPLGRRLPYSQLSPLLSVDCVEKGVICLSLLSLFLDPRLVAPHCLSSSVFWRFRVRRLWSSLTLSLLGLYEAGRCLLQSSLPDTCCE